MGAMGGLDEDMMSESPQPVGGGSGFATPLDARTARITVGSGGVIRSWNQAPEALSGDSPAVAVGRPLLEVLAAPAPPAEHAALVGHLASGRSFEVSVRGRGGLEFLLRGDVPPPLGWPGPW
jgi:PAS domain-containing protein